LDVLGEENINTFVRGVVDGELDTPRAEHDRGVEAFVGAHKHVPLALGVALER